MLDGLGHDATSARKREIATTLDLVWRFRPSLEDLAPSSSAFSMANACNVNCTSRYLVQYAYCDSYCIVAHLTFLCGTHLFLHSLSRHEAFSIHRYQPKRRFVENLEITLFEKFFITKQRSPHDDHVAVHKVQDGLRESHHDLLMAIDKLNKFRN